MTDSFLHNHQSALDNQREDDAIQYLQDCGVYPDPLEDIVEDDFFPMETDYEPTDDEVKSSFGTKWHDGL